MFATPDYTKQLDEIVRALKRPSTPIWLVALIGGAAGGGFAIAAELIRGRYDESRARTRMQSALYNDLADLFLRVDRIRNLSSQLGEECTRNQFKDILQNLNTEHTNRNPDIYFQLSERRSADMLYTWFRKIIDEPQLMIETVSMILTMFANEVHDGVLRKELFKQFVQDKSEAAMVLTRAEQIYSENQGRIQRRLDELDGKATDDF
jgi:hypothetical protein